MGSGASSFGFSTLEPTAKGPLKAPGGHTDQVEWIYHLPKHERVITGGRDGHIIEWDTREDEDGTPTMVPIFWRSLPPGSVAISCLDLRWPSWARLFTASRRGDVREWQIVPPEQCEPGVRAVHFARALDVGGRRAAAQMGFASMACNARYVFVGGLMDGRVLKIDRNDGFARDQAGVGVYGDDYVSDEPFDSIVGLEPMGEGRLLSASSRGRVAVLNTESMEVVAEVCTPRGGEVAAVKLLGGQLYVAEASGTVTQVDPLTGARGQVFTGHLTPPTALAAGHGRLFSAAEADGVMEHALGSGELLDVEVVVAGRLHPRRRRNAIRCMAVAPPPPGSDRPRLYLGLVKGAVVEYRQHAVTLQASLERLHTTAGSARGGGSHEVVQGGGWEARSREDLHTVTRGHDNRLCGRRLVS